MPNSGPFPSRWFVLLEFCRDQNKSPSSNGFLAFNGGSNVLGLAVRDVAFSSENTT